MPIYYYTTTNTAAPSSSVIKDVTQSPLWPLQNEMNNITMQTLNNPQIVPSQIARVWPIKLQTEDLFAQWTRFYSLTLLRNIILASVSAPQVDLSNDPLLNNYQQQILQATHWNDTLPS